MTNSNSTSTTRACLFWFIVFIACLTVPMVSEVFGVISAAVLFGLSVKRNS